MKLKIPFLFKEKQNNSPDVLGRYPEHMQVHALPERRYIKTSRLLAVIIILNIALMVAAAGFFTYIADRVDVTIANRRAIHIYNLDSSRKVLQPAEAAHRSIAAVEIFTEQIIRDYIQNRHEIVWDNNTMQTRWDIGGPIATYSHYKRVYVPFRVEADNIFNESRSKEFVRDVHLYELKRVYSNLWEGVFDTFDMPVPDSYAPLCPCTDNSKACLECKAKNTFRRMRFRVFIRFSFANKPTLKNPFGFMITSYNLLYQPIHEDEKYWGVPSVLKPDL